MFLADYKKSQVLPVCAAFEYLWVCISHHPLPSWAQYLWKDGHKSSHAEQNNKSFPPAAQRYSLFSFLWIWPASVLISSRRVWSSFFISVQKIKNSKFSKQNPWIGQPDRPLSSDSLLTCFCLQLSVNHYTLYIWRYITHLPSVAPRPAQFSVCSRGQTPSFWAAGAPGEFLGSDDNKERILGNKRTILLAQFISYIKQISSYSLYQSL